MRFFFFCRTCSGRVPDTECRLTEWHSSGEESLVISIVWWTHHSSRECVLGYQRDHLSGGTRLSVMGCPRELNYAQLCSSRLTIDGADGLMEAGDFFFFRKSREHQLFPLALLLYWDDLVKLFLEMILFDSSRSHSRWWSAPMIK